MSSRLFRLLPRAKQLSCQESLSPTTIYQSWQEIKHTVKLSVVISKVNLVVAHPRIAIMSAVVHLCKPSIETCNNVVMMITCDLAKLWWCLKYRRASKYKGGSACRSVSSSCEVHVWNWWLIYPLDKLNISCHTDYVSQGLCASTRSWCSCCIQ